MISHTNYLLEERSADVPEGEELKIENSNLGSQKYVFDYGEYGTLMLTLQSNESILFTVGKKAPSITVIDENVEH